VLPQFRRTGIGPKGKGGLPVSPLTIIDIGDRPMVSPLAATKRPIVEDLL
jgi:hypothetical protein